MHPKNADVRTQFGQVTCSGTCKIYLVTRNAFEAHLMVRLANGLDLLGRIHCLVAHQAFQATTEFRTHDVSASNLASAKSNILLLTLECEHSLNTWTQCCYLIRVLLFQTTTLMPLLARYIA